ncbi:MAG: copper-translocating P-type ATPase [Gemmatimonadota bacterium]
MVADFKRRFWVSVVLTLPVLVLAPLIQRVLNLEQQLAFPGDRYVQFAFATAVFLYGGWPFLKGFVEDVRERSPGMMTLIAVAIGVAYTYSSAVVFGLAGEVFFWELVTLIDIMLLGHWIEMRSVMGASRALEELVRLMPAIAHRVSEDGSVVDVPVTEIAPGDRILVKPGEKIPTDGSIIEGHTTINESMLTGESKPVEKGPDAEVIGGSVNGESAFTFRITKTGADTYLAQVIDLVKEAQESRSRSQDLANKAARWLTIVAIGVGTLTLVAWLLAGQTFNFALERMVTVMVISCPHALGLAVPLVVAVSTSLAAGNGLLIRDRSAFERARELQAIVFDKTGTLTEGRFGVTDVIPLGDRGEEELLRLAASLESRSEHPIAQGIVREAESRGLSLSTPKQFQAIPGKGALARLDGMDVRVVSPGYLEEHQIRAQSDQISAAAEQGKTVVYVLVDEHLEGALALADVIREESREALERLKAMGIRSIMLTGDSRQVAHWVAEELELDDYFAEVLPHQKSERIKEIKSQGLLVGMTGDGVNDAPALVAADVGIAIGAGTDVAVESADIVLVRSDPRDVASIVTLARVTFKKMKQNLWWAAGYNIVAIPLATGLFYNAGIVLSPAIGAGLMSLSTVIVAINARLLGRTGTGS